jgi:hypothetical protein
MFGYEIGMGNISSRDALPEKPIPICQPEDVSEAKWVTRADNLEMIGNKTFINHFNPELLQLEDLEQT